jgi:hypothetical protein
MLPGLRLRRVREHLGLTYRDVERCSYEIAAKRGRPEFILHISRLADMENRNVVPGLHKLYALAVMQPHPLSRCMPEWWQMPDEAEIVGRVTGVVTRLNEPWNNWAEAFPAAHAGSNRKAP